MRRTTWTGMLAAAMVLAIGIPAQAAPTTDQAGRAAGKSTSPAGVVPLTADQITQSAATVSTAKFYRDSKGRTRVESGSTVTITDPATQATIRLDTGSGTFQRQARKPSVRPATVQQNQDLAGPSRPLGTADVNGVRAEGRAYTVTTKSGAREVTIWLATGLQLAVQTSVGTSYKQSYTNIRTGAEPSADLFTVPAGYKEAVKQPAPSRAGINQSCPVSYVDPLVLNSYDFFLGSGYVFAVTDPGIGCFFAADGAIFEYPLSGFPTFPLGYPYDEWFTYDNGGGGLPFLPWVAFGDVAWLAFNGSDTTTVDSLIILTVWCC
jgi:hypothetical protein